MKRARTQRGEKVALALTWDGARWPLRGLSREAKAFLGEAARDLPSPAQLAEMLATDAVRELRICWVPQLTGDAATIASPFTVLGGKRVVFVSAKTQRLGDVLAVVYQRRP